VRPRIIFLDNGGVLTDNDVRAEQWRRLLGEYLSPRLGGTPAIWGEANRIAFGAQWERFLAWRDERLEAGEWGDFFQQAGERERWLREMCAHAGVDAPDDALGVARAAEEYVFPRIRASYADTAPAVEALHARGYHLATASGETSYELDHYLKGMGLRERFAGPLFGPDLVQALKGGRTYYDRLIAASGIAPSEALVVDNEERAIAAAAQAGARTVYVRRGDTPPAADADHTVPDLLGLLGLLDLMD
jgi:FMN phosphatase YigB (HAD superfamily)